MFLVLSKLRYKDIKKRVHSIGMEFDLDAVHTDTLKPVICECKALEYQVSTGDIQTLIAKLVHEDNDASLMEGMFFSTSGFTGTAAKWYETLPETHKQRLKLYDADAISQVLRDNGFLLTDEKYDEMVRKHTSYQMGDRYTVYYDSHLYVVQTLRTGGASTHFMILTNEGEPINKKTEDAIIRLDPGLRSLSHIDIIQEKLILALLDAEGQDLAKLSSAIVEYEKNVAIAADELISSGIITKNQESGLDSFTLNQSMDTLTTLVGRFANSDKKYQLMTSKYVEKMTNDVYAMHIKERFKLDLDKDLTNMLIKASQIFPGVLHYLLLGDNVPYQNSHRHLEELKKSGGDQAYLMGLSQSPFFHEISIRILADMQLLDGNYLGKKKGIKGIFTKNIFKIASDKNLIMSIYTEGVNFLATAAGPIEKGSFLSATDVSLFLGLGDTLYHLELYDDATQDYDRVIESGDKRAGLIAAAWNNKGLCYKALGQCKEAVCCYEEALKIDENMIVTLGNLAVCYQELGDPRADEVKRKIEELQESGRSLDSELDG